MFRAKEETFFDLILDSIECVFEGEKIYTPDMYTKKELSDFVDMLDDSVVEKMKLFFDTMPQVIGKVEFTCACGKFQESEEVASIDSFLN